MIMPLPENMTYCRGEVSGFFLNFALEIFFDRKVEEKKQVFLSLGSNTGDRLAHLTKAVRLLQDKAGEILHISPVYLTQAWGFEGRNFLNIVVELSTTLSPHALLDTTKHIEKEIGRQPRKNLLSYSDRPIDIDILTYGKEQIKIDGLQIPHKHLAERNFVLFPWKDIAPSFVVPGYDSTVEELAEVSTDTLLAEKIAPGLEMPYDFLTIEGNIGAGKTTLAKMIAGEYGAQLILERFEENPFLPKFYEDPARYAFPLEMSFLADRYQQLIDELSQRDLFKKFVVSDYFVIKSLIFAGVTLQDEEFRLYRKIFNFMYNDLKKPDLYVYLYRETDDLLHNIAKRGRDYEKNITADYLKKIHNGYMSFIKTASDLNVLMIDVTGMDFQHKPEVYEAVKLKILNGLKEKEERIRVVKICEG